MNRLRERELGKIPQDAEVNAHIRGFVQLQRFVETFRLAYEAITNWFRPMVDWTAEMRKLTVSTNALNGAAHVMEGKLVGPVIIKTHESLREQRVGEPWVQNPQRR